MATSFTNAIKETIELVLKDVPQGTAFSAQQVIDKFRTIDDGKWYHEKLKNSDSFHTAHRTLGKSISDVCADMGIAKVVINGNDLKCFTPKTIIGSTSKSQLYIKD